MTPASENSKRHEPRDLTAAEDRARANTQERADSCSASASSEISTEALPTLGASPGDAATLRRFVTFEETGEEREVKTWCLRCQADSDFTILSPTGKAHYSSDTGEDTRCGIEATGDGWWHRL